MDKIINGFEKNNYKIIEKISFQNKNGIVAEHNEVFNYKTGKNKRAYFLEGTPYQIGKLLGLLAEEEINLVTNKFLFTIIKTYLCYIDDNKKWVFNNIPKFVWNWLTNYVIKETSKLIKFMPDHIINEFNGIVDGCKEKNSDTTVSLEKLVAVNYGFDFLQSQLYNPNTKLIYSRIW